MDSSYLIVNIFPVFLLQVMIEKLEQVVTMVLNSFQHSHMHVRWSAINAIGQLSTDLGPDLQVQYHQRVLPALASAMDDFQNPRVQVHYYLWSYGPVSDKIDDLTGKYLTSEGFSFCHAGLIEKK